MTTTTDHLTGDTNVNDVVHAARLAHAFHDAACSRIGQRLGRSDTTGLAGLTNGAATMTEFGHRIGLSRAAVTTLCDRLEDLDLIDRVRVVGDRRTLALVLTTTGHELVTNAASDAAEIIAAENAELEQVPA